MAALEFSAKEADGFVTSPAEKKIFEVAFADELVEDMMVFALVGEMLRIDGVGVQVLNILVSDAGIITETGKKKKEKDS